MKIINYSKCQSGLNLLVNNIEKKVTVKKGFLIVRINVFSKFVVCKVEISLKLPSISMGFTVRTQ